MAGYVIRKSGQEKPVSKHATKALARKKFDKLAAPYARNRGANPYWIEAASGRFRAPKGLGPFFNPSTIKSGEWIKAKAVRVRRGKLEILR